MRRLLAASAIALVVLLSAAATPIAGAHRHCRKTFTVKMAQRAAGAAWAGTREPTAKDWKALFYFVRCQRNPQARPYVHWYYRSQAKQNARRRYDAAHPIQYAVASWFTDSQEPTACGFHAAYGVANKTLPCGAAVTFYYHGYTQDAVVEDRGPYVAGREWDLGESTKNALHFDGVNTVGYRIN